MDIFIRLPIEVAVLRLRRGTAALYMKVRVRRKGISVAIANEYYFPSIK